MKKLIITIILLLMFTISNCKREKDTSKTNQANTDTTEVTQDSTEVLQ